MGSTTTTATTAKPILASHKWEEQFKREGERLGTPPADKIADRIRELLNAIDATDDGSLKRVYEQEVRWRRVQLERVRDSSES